MIQKEATGVFLIKRFFRVYPLYIFAVLAEAILAKAVHGMPIVEWSVLLPRLLLLGDFFSTPYALAGVEWTLRLEIVFYLIVAAVKFFRPQHIAAGLLVVYACITVALQLLPAFPGSAPLYVGYVTLYLPFLFVGSCIYFYEKNSFARSICVLFIFYIVGSYLVLLPKVNPAFMNTNFAVYAVALFLLAWAFRKNIKSVAAVTLLSELTYSVYLFHNWSWYYIDRFIVKAQPGSMFDKLKITVVLLVLCFLVHRLVEKKFIVLGARLSSRFGGAKAAQVVKGSRTPGIDTAPALRDDLPS